MFHFIEQPLLQELNGGLLVAPTRGNAGIASAKLEFHGSDRVTAEPMSAALQIRRETDKPGRSRRDETRGSNGVFLAGTVEPILGSM